jgi:hypothetical protein
MMMREKEEGASIGHRESNTDSQGCELADKLSVTIEIWTAANKPDLGFVCVFLVVYKLTNTGTAN